MKILMISNDHRIANVTSSSAQRMIKLGTLTDQLAILLLGYSGPQVKLSEQVMVWPLGNKLSSIFKVKNLANKIFPDPDYLVTCQDPVWAGLAGYWIKRATGAKLQLQIHTDIMSPYYRRDSWANRGRYWLSQYLIPRADCIRVVSDRVRRSLLDKFKNISISVLPIWVNPQAGPAGINLRQKYPQFDKIILIASRLTREKNIPLALTTLKKLLPQYPKTLLLIVGEGPEKKNLKNRIQKLELTANVIIEPWTDSLAGYYQIADLYLLTSNFEGYGRTVVEAMANNCPVVMTNVGLAGELAKADYNALVTPINDPEAILRAIQRLWANLSLKEGLIKAAKASLSQLSTEADYLAQYQKAWLTC